MTVGIDMELKHVEWHWYSWRHIQYIIFTIRISMCVLLFFRATKRSKYTKLQYILPLILNGCDILSVALTGEQWLIIESCVYWTVHHLDSWIQTGQLDVTCFIISLFNAQHVSDVNTSILRNLRLICWVISWVILIWFDVCWCYIVVCLGWCGIRMQPEALVPQPAYGYHTTTANIAGFHLTHPHSYFYFLLTLWCFCN